MSERDAYVEKMKARLDEWNAELAKLDAKARQASGDVKLNYERQITSLRAQRDALRAKLAEVKEAGEAAWGSIKEGLENAWGNLKTGLEKVTAGFK